MSDLGCPWATQVRVTLPPSVTERSLLVTCKLQYDYDKNKCHWYLRHIHRAFLSKEELIEHFWGFFSIFKEGKENENRVVYLWWDLNLNAADLKSSDVLCTLEYLFIHNLTYYSLIHLKQKISSIDLKWRIKKGVPSQRKLCWTLWDYGLSRTRNKEVTKKEIWLQERAI